MSLSKQVSIFFAVATLFPSLSAEAQSRRVSSRDRTQIAQTILQRETFTDSETWSSDLAENTVYLLRGTLSANELPRIKGLRFILISLYQIDEMKKTGVEYYRFENFQHRKSTVRVFFTREYLNVQGRGSNGGSIIYTCRKTSSGWRVIPHDGPAYTAESK